MGKTDLGVKEGVPLGIKNFLIRKAMLVIVPIIGYISFCLSNFSGQKGSSKIMEVQKRYSVAVMDIGRIGNTFKENESNMGMKIYFFDPLFKLENQTEQ